MFKRIRWMTVGAGLGVTGSVWARRRVLRLLRSYTPPEVASRAAASARNEWRAALAEGREAMRQREAELRSGVDRRAWP